MKRMFGVLCAVGFLMLCVGSMSSHAQDVDQSPAKLAEAKPERKPRDYQDTSYALTQYEVEKFSQLLDLSPEQHETMMAMFAEVRRRVFEAEMPIRTASDEWMVSLREYLDAAPEERDAKKLVMDEQREKMELLRAEFGGLKLELVEEFFEDLKLLLGANQIELFDDAIRWRHRYRLLRWGMIPYSDFSVASMARSMDLSVDRSRFDGEDPPSLDAVYREYEIELDRLLMRRVAAEREFAGAARGMGESRSGTDMTDSPEDKEKWREAVGEVNLRLVSMQKKYITRIASLLTPEDAAAFQQRCYEQAYWHVLDDESMDRLFSELLKHPSLTEEQRAHITALQSEYEAAKAPISREWIRALDEFLSKGGARVAGAEVPAAIGDPLNETDDADGLFEFAKQKMALRDEWKDRIAQLRLEFGLDTPEQPEG